jgi:poly(3-hydroxybutyrate) depolymerase
MRDGVEVADVSALVEALAGRPGVDPGRVGVVVSGIAAQALAHRIERLDPAPSAVALVTGETLPSLAPPEGMEVRSFAAEDPPAAAREASRWLRGQLAVD